MRLATPSPRVTGITPWRSSHGRFRRARDADDGGAVQREELHGDRSDPARGGGDDDNVAGLGPDRSRRGPGRRTRDEQRTCDLPGDSRWARGQIVGGDRDELGLTGAIVGESDHLVADRDIRNVGTEFVDDACEVASLARGERCRKAFPE